MILMILVPLIAAIVGVVLVAAFHDKPPLNEIGRALLWGGVFVSLLAAAHQIVRIP